MKKIPFILGKGIDIMKKLVMASDMADKWGVDRRVINNWKNRDPEFPKPIQVIGCGKYPIYLEDEMIEYGKRKGIGDE